MENLISTLEVPRSEHHRPKVKNAKVKEIKNLEDYKTFEIVEDVGQETTGSCLEVTKKEKYDSQKTEYKLTPGVRRRVTQTFSFEKKDNWQGPD